MAQHNIMRVAIAAGLAASAASASAVDFNITGFVRQEIAVSITDEAYNNKAWEPAIDRSTFIPSWTPGNPFTPDFSGGADNLVQLDANNAPIPFPNANYFGASVATGNGCIGGNFFNLGPTDGAACGPAGAINPAGTSRYGDVPFNMFNTRAEIEVQAKFNENVAAYARVRAYFDGTSTFTDDNVQMEKHFLTDTGWGDGRGNLLELQNNDMMLDIPSLYADINLGSAWFRIGQQQIAWGEALFFRVFDVANGLDLRRHLFLDVAAEEYADERVASPGVRASYTFSNGWEVDGFVQMFSPTLYPNTNTPYSVIGQDFTVQEAQVGPGFDEAENSLNFGARLIMPDLFMRDLTVSVMAVNRRNPDGVFKWDSARTQNFNAQTASGNNYFCNVSALFGLNPAGAPMYGSAGGAIGPDGRPFGTGGGDGNCSQPFEQDAFGTMSALDWWTQAARSRFDPVTGATAAIGEWAGSNGFTQFIGPGGFFGADGVAGNLDDGGGQTLGLPNYVGIGKRSDGKWDLVTVESMVAPDALPSAQLDALRACTASNSCTPVTGNLRKTAGIGLVNGFFTNYGSLRGHIAREFKRENIFGVSFNYIITADPSSFLDQLIVRGEMSYTPDKVFTSVDASTLFTTSDEILASVIFEKYQSIFDSLPATYLVFEWMHRTDTDLGGRLLEGYSDGADLWYEDEDGSPDGVGSANYLTFAFQQPFPNLIWRADFAVLADVRGGLFFQPGVRYKPSGEWQFDMYANIAADVGGESDDMLETFDDMDEVFVRATYYF